MKMLKDAGFEGVELALAAKGPLSMESTDEQIVAIREKAKAVARREMESGKLLGADVVMLCPGAVGVDFQPEDVVPDAHEIEFFAGCEIIDYDVVYERSRDVLIELAQYAEKVDIKIGVENIRNKFLLSPLEMRTFIDEINSPYVGVWLNVANMMMFGYPEQWIMILGKRIIKVHLRTSAAR